LRRVIILQYSCSVYSPAFPFRKLFRDQLEGIPVTNIYYGPRLVFATLLSILLMTVGLWNAKLAKSEKGFYAMSYVLRPCLPPLRYKKYKGYESLAKQEETMEAISKN